MTSEQRLADSLLRLLAPPGFPLPAASELAALSNAAEEEPATSAPPPTSEPALSLPEREGAGEEEVVRKRGGQPGNQNARKHGFYSDCLTPAEQALLETAGDARGLTSEIALLRVKLLSLIANPNTPPDLLLRTVRTLKGLIEVQNRFHLPHRTT